MARGVGTQVYRKPTALEGSRFWWLQGLTQRTERTNRLAPLNYASRRLPQITQRVFPQGAPTPNTDAVGHVIRAAVCGSRLLPTHRACQTTKRLPSTRRQSRGPGVLAFRRYKGVARAINRHQTRRLVSDGCQSGRLGTPGKRVYRKVPRVRIPPHPPHFRLTLWPLGS